MVFDLARGDGELDFGGVFKQRQMLLFLAVLLGAQRCPRQIVGAQNDVLRGHRDRTTGSGREDVVRRKHQLAALQLSFHRKRDVDGHLVTVEVRVVSGTNERMDADGLTLDEFGLERLNG